MYLYRDDDLELRLLEPRHAQEVFDAIVANREHLAAWLPFAEATTQVGDTRSFIEGVLRSFGEGRGPGTFGIWYESEFVGIAGFHEVDRLANRTEIGYWLSEASQGKGIVTKSVRAMVDHAFFELGLNKLEIHMAPGNVRSQRIPERLGFTREGVIRQAINTGSGYHDRTVYGLLRSEWGGNGSDR